MQHQLFGDHGQPRIYRSKRKTDNTDLKRRYHQDPEVRARMQASARRRHQLKVYGITEADYQLMLERQGGVCAACGAPPKKFTPKSQPRLHVDHCHNTGEVRGLLCQNCNSALGHAKDSTETLQRLIRYLERDHF